MTANDTTPAGGQESSDVCEQCDDREEYDGHDVEDWEGLGREAMAQLLLCRRSKIDSALQRVEQHLRSGKGPNEGDLRQIRNAIETLEDTVEMTMGENMEGTEAFEREGNRLTSGELAEMLGTDLEQLRRLDEDRADQDGADGPD